MDHEKTGPIQEVTWGKYVIEGQEHSDNGVMKGVEKDIRVIGKEVSAWKERTGHILIPEMITGVFGIGIDVLIIGTGFDGAIEVRKDTIEEIHDLGIRELIVDKTPEACKKYNEFYGKGYIVAMLAHGTC